MKIYKEAILNSITGELTYVEFTPEELEAYNAEQAKLTAERAALAGEQAAKEAARQAALDKLRAIGLTDEEIAALVGA